MEKNKNRRTFEFYKKNGYISNPYNVSVYGVLMNIMSLNGKVTFNEYYELKKALSTNKDSLVKNLYLVKNS